MMKIQKLLKMMLSCSRTMEQFKMSSSQRTKTSFICTPLRNYHLSSPKREPQPILEYTKPDHDSTNLQDVPKIIHNMIRHTLLPRCGTFDAITDTDLCIMYHLMTKTKLNLCFIILQYMIDSCLDVKQKVVELSYGMHMTPIFKVAQVSLQGEECEYTFMRFTTKTLGQLHITTSNMPTPPTSETSGSVKRHADQKVKKTRKKIRVEKVRNLSSIQK